MRGESEFRDFVIGRDVLAPGVEAHGRSSYHLIAEDVRLILKKRGLTQFLHHIGLNRRTASEKAIKEALLSNPNRIVLSAVKMGEDEEGREVWYVFRATTVEYIPIPHRVLGEAIEKSLKLGRFSVKRFGKSTWLMWRIGEDRGHNFFLAVRNANTGDRAVIVTIMARNKVCGNIHFLPVRRRAIHITDVKSVLNRVVERVAEVLAIAKIVIDNYFFELEKLQRQPLTAEEIDEIVQKLPRKYRDWWVRELRRNVERYGRNKYSLYQTATYFVARARGTTRQVAERLANKLVAVSV